MNTLEKRRIIRSIRIYLPLILPLAMIGVSVAGAVFGIYPLYRSIDRIQTEIKAINEKIVKYEGKVSALSSANETTVRSQLASVLTAVPSEKDIPLLLAYADAIGGQSGLTNFTINLPSPGQVSTDSATLKMSALERKIGVGMISYKLSATGTVDQIIQFVDTLKNSRRLTRIESLDMSIKNDRITIQMACQSYYSVLPTVSVTLDEPLKVLSTEEQKLIADVLAYPQFGGQYSIESIAEQNIPSGKLNPFSVQ